MLSIRKQNGCMRADSFCIIEYNININFHFILYVYLVYNDNISVAEDHRVLSHHIITFGDRNDHDTFLCTKWKVRRSDQISNILNEKHIKLRKRQSFEAVLYHVRIQMTFFPGGYVNCRYIVA